jgi:hypothetical protein
MRVKNATTLAAAGLLALTMAGCAAAIQADTGKLLTPQQRLSVLRRAQIWAPTPIPSMDVTRGPDGGFPPGADVACDYKETTFGGHSPKFGCVIPEPPGTDAKPEKADAAGKPDDAGKADKPDKPDKDVSKVRYGNDNGEIYAGVATTRLLWALGYGADGLYPVHVICKKCPAMTDGIDVDGSHERFNVAAIERPFAGHKIEAIGTQDGWAWREIDLVNEAAGGAPRAQRDGLKLLAVLLQHTDNKAEQQRLICRSKGHSRDELVNCADPFMMIHDVGLTFGRANWLNHQDTGSTNFALWSTTPIWKDRAKCMGNLYGSHTGTLHDPVISEEGRAFLSGLLAQLTDAQLHDLFTVAMFDRKPHGGAPIDAWVTAFKAKRDEIAATKCPS